jgi:hypothetical protein
MIGRITTVTISISDTPITIKEDARPRIPVVAIDGIVDGYLRGNTSGHVRLFIGEELVITDGSGTFAVPPDLFLEHIVTVDIPEGMNFVASRRGKKYYPLSSSQAKRLIPENRLYFKTAEEAQKAGYEESLY